ncbi:MAG: Response regulator containing a CheY-like receiver domain and an DNA-binding domain [Acidimicrobiales bacterium]|jgi:DNA-binding CsgD family transcriptional regulator|nr:Response regulator containing a CheY-like receiver domain and an DNA-binding domain [Acidimicrobiales bacterium]
MTTRLDDADLDALFHGSPVPLAVLDTSSGQLRRANELFLGLMRIERPDIAGLAFEALLPADHRPSADDLSDGLRDGTIEYWQGRAEFRRGDGGVFDVRYRLWPLAPLPRRVPTAVLAVELSPLRHARPNRLDLTADGDGDELSPRQAEILDRLAAGERVPAIAKSLFLSTSTVRNHLSAIFRMYGVHSQHELLTLIGAPTRS